MIDTAVCENRRWNKLAYNTRFPLEKKKAGASNIRIVDVTFNLAKKNGPFPFAEDTDTYKNLRQACEKTALEGFHCYDDMFLWAHDLIKNIPSVCSVIRDRFPLLFLDEAQDNREDQSIILQRIFMEGKGAVIRQRFGDENQAIFDSKDEQIFTDEFPSPAIKKDLPNSHRFGQRIADLADPLGVVPYCLQGHGPKRCLDSGEPAGQHTVFLFKDNEAGKVLQAYAELLIATFSEAELRDGTFSAVGQIHRPSDKPEQHKYPHHVGHYWPEYDPELAYRDPKPKTFVQFLCAGTSRAGISGEAHLALEKIAEGILRLAAIAKTTKPLLQRKYSHRFILNLLQEDNNVGELYEDLINTFVVKREALTEKRWTDHWRSVVLQIGEAIAGESLSSDEANVFLAWDNQSHSKDTTPIAQFSRDNVFRYPATNPKVRIRVGSIHSVKGETHTATLVLETFFRDHNLEKLVNWLCGGASGGQGKSAQDQYRLKLHYVAMTRPTHLLCLAMKAGCDEQLIEKLVGRGWQVTQL